MKDVVHSPQLALKELVSGWEWGREGFERGQDRGEGDWIRGSTGEFERAG